MEIKGLISDLGGVIVGFDNGLYLNGLARAYGCSPSHVNQALFPELSELFHRGKIAPAQFYETMNRKLGGRIPFEEFSQTYCRIFSLNPDTADVLSSLRPRFRMCLLSNTNILHWDYCRNKFSILGLFDHCTLSHEVGIVKPERAIYEHALSSIGCRAQEAIFIDDIEEYVVAAREIGVHAIHFASASQTLSEIERIVSE